MDQEYTAQMYTLEICVVVTPCEIWILITQLGHKTTSQTAYSSDDVE